jgi:hypothetical protein
VKAAWIGKYAVRKCHGALYCLTFEFKSRCISPNLGHTTQKKTHSRQNEKNDDSGSYEISVKHNEALPDHLQLYYYYLLLYCLLLLHGWVQYIRVASPYI